MRQDQWLSREAAATYLTLLGCPITHRTLEKMAGHQTKDPGPPYIRPTYKVVRYSKRDLDAWAKKRMIRVG